MAKRGRQPTVKEVAARAGVSPMTVSRTLAGGTNVRPDVQKRVMEAVSELGYRRNENARSIRPGQRSGLIGVAITNIANPYYGTFTLGVEEAVSESGRRIILGNTAEDPERERQLIHDFLGRRVDGLIVVPTESGGAHLRRSIEDGVPVVLASRRLDEVDADSVVLDDEGGAKVATEALLDAGHRRVAYLGNSSAIFTGRRRLAGYEAAHAARGLRSDPALVRAGQQDVAAAQAATAALLALPDPPTAIFCANNRNAIGAVAEIGARLRAGTSGPVEVVSFDDFELSQLMPVPVGVVEHDPRALGREAAQLLVARLDGEVDDSVPRSVVLPVRLARRP